MCDCDNNNQKLADEVLASHAQVMAEAAKLGPDQVIQNRLRSEPNSEWCECSAPTWNWDVWDYRVVNKWVEALRDVVSRKEDPAKNTFAKYQEDTGDQPSPRIVAARLKGHHPALDELGKAQARIRDLEHEMATRLKDAHDEITQTRTLHVSCFTECQRLNGVIRSLCEELNTVSKEFDQAKANLEERDKALGQLRLELIGASNEKAAVVWARENDAEIIRDQREVLIEKNTEIKILKDTVQALLRRNDGGAS